MANVLDFTGKIEPSNGDRIDTSPQEGVLYDTIVEMNEISACEFADIPNVVQKWVDILAPGGQLHIIEPSAEWAAREILKNNVDVVRVTHLLGRVEKPFRSYCLLTMLRDLVSMMGLVPRKAGTMPYIIAKDDLGREYKGDQHYLVGEKPNPEEPSKQWVR